MKLYLLFVVNPSLKQTVQWIHPCLGPCTLVRKSDNYRIEKSEQPYDQLFVFIYLFVPVTTSSTFTRVALLIDH